MRSALLMTGLLFGLGFGAIVSAQSKPSTRRPAPRPAATPEKRVPPYYLNLRIADDSRLYVSVISDPSERNLDPWHLDALITDLPTGADKFNTANNTFPKVVIEPSPNISMLTLWNPITLFRKDKTEIKVKLDMWERGEAGDPIELIVPWKNSDPNENLKPNPLLLFVSIKDDGTLSLNSESIGSIRDPAPLSKRLSEVFKRREENGVFREKTTDVEKTVIIVMPMGERKVSDLRTVAKAVRDPGADRIELLMESPLPVVPIRRQIISER